MSVRVRSVLLSRVLGPAFLIVAASAATAQQADTSAAKPAPVKDTVSMKPMKTKEYGTLPARFQFAVGGYLPHISTTAKIATAHLPSTDINLERQLGLNPNTQSIDLYGQWRFAKKNVLSLEYFGISRNASRTITDSLIVNDTVYQAGATVYTKSGLSYYGVTYRYYLWRRERWELGAGLGIDVMGLDATFGLRATAGNHADSAHVSGSFVAPVPMLGIYADWEAIPRLYIRGTFQTLYIANIASYGGLVRDRRIAAEWYPLHNYGFGLGWHYVGLDIKKTQPNGAYVKLSYAIQGLSLYATAAFGPSAPVPHRASAPRSEPPEGQDFGLVPRTVSFSVGGYLPSINSSGRLSSPTNPGTSIDLEQKLGFPTNTQTLNVGAELRIANKSLLTFTYFGFNRSGTATLSDSIAFGDSVYHAGATIEAGGSLKYLGFSYRYYVWRKKAWQVGFGLGLDEIEAETHLGIKVTTANKADSLHHSGSLAVPAPMLGVYGDWELFHGFYLRGTAQWLGATLGDVNVSITDDRLDAEYYFSKNYGVGAGYHYVGFDGSKTFKNGEELKINYSIQGPVLYLTAAF